MSERWAGGLWLGKSQTSDEHVVWALDGSGAKCARSIRLLAENPISDMLEMVNRRPVEHSTGLRLRTAEKRRVARDDPGRDPAEPLEDLLRWMGTPPGRRPGK